MRSLKIAAAGLVTLGFLVTYQNCAKQKSARVVAVNSDSSLPAKCSNSSLLGQWAEDPDDPTNPAKELLTVHTDCVALSRLCKSQITLPAMAPHNGVPIQSAVTIKVAGSSLGGTCLPNGEYSCNVSYGASSDGDVYAADCSGLRFAFYKLPTDKISRSGPPFKRIYLTRNVYPANFTIAQADAICLSDPSRPVDLISAKAMVGHTLDRIACSTQYCQNGSAGQKDWVFTPNTDYYRLDRIKVATTNAEALLPTVGSPAVIVAVGEDYERFQNHYWSGFQTLVRNNLPGPYETTWVVDANCQNWTTTSAVFHAREGVSVLPSGSSASSRNTSCDRESRFVCVEQ